MYELYFEDQDYKIPCKVAILDDRSIYKIREIETGVEGTITGKDIRDNIRNSDIVNLEYNKVNCRYEIDIRRPQNLTKVANLRTSKEGSIGLISWKTIAENELSAYILITVRGGFRFVLNATLHGAELVLLDDMWLTTNGSLVTRYGECDFVPAEVLSDSQLCTKDRVLKRRALLNGTNYTFELHRMYPSSSMRMYQHQYINIKTGEYVSEREYHRRISISKHESLKPFKCCIVNYKDKVSLKKDGYITYFRVRKNGVCIGWDSTTWKYCKGKRDDVITELGGMKSFSFYADTEKVKEDVDRHYKEQCLLPCQQCTFEYNKYSYTLIGGTGFALLGTGESLYAVRCDDYYSAMPYIHERGISIITSSGDDADIFELDITMQDINTMLDTCETVYDVLGMIETHIVNCVGKIVRR